MNGLVERLGWMLLHSLWEGAAIWLGLELILAGLRKKSAHLRHGVACVGLAAMVLAPWATFGAMDWSARVQDGARMPSVQQGEAPLVAAADASRQGEITLPLWATENGGNSLSLEKILPWLVGGWMLGMAIWILRLLLAWRFLLRLLRMPLPPLAPEWRERLDHLCRRAGVAISVRLGESLAVTGPLVVDWAKPLILLPLGALAQLSPEQVEAILLHELAHLRRHDFLVNLLQCVAEAVFFYHPAIHAVNARIRREREWACDDLTVAWCENPLGYARALEAFETFRPVPLALAAGQGNLLERIRRIVLGTEPGRPQPWVFGLAGFLSIGTYLVTMFAVPVLASKAMPGNERIALIDSALVQNAGDVLLPVNDAATVRVEGTLRTEDGRPLPPGVVIYTLTENLGSMTSEDMEIDHMGHFGRNFRPGRITLMFSAPGYAPLRYRVPPSAYGKPLDLVLSKGMPALLRLTDAEGKSVEGVKVTGLISGRENGPQMSVPETMSDADGRVDVGRVEKETVLNLEATKPGWEFTAREFTDWSGTTITWIIRPSLPGTGLVIDADTRKPIPAASILLAAWWDISGKEQNSYRLANAPVLGKTDAAGMFRLEGLNRDYLYSLYVRAKGYQTAVVRTKGTGPLPEMALKKGIRVEGKILDPQGLLRGEKNPEISCELSLSMTPSMSYGYALTQPLPNPGPETAFAFDDLSPQSVVFRVAGQPFRLEVPDHNVTGFVIDLGGSTPVAMPAGNAVRTVRIHLVSGPGQPPVTGELGVQYTRKTTGPGYPEELVEECLPMIEGTATLKVSTPNRIQIYPDHLVGYWFKNDILKIEPGAQDVLFSMPVLPAGVIRGRVTVEPGARGGPFFCSAVAVRTHPAVEVPSLDAMGQRTGENPVDRYVSNPLPMGGVYSIILWHDYQFVVSPPVAITPEKPVAVCDLSWIKGSTLSGVFVDEQGQPYALRSIAIHYEYPGHGFGTEAGYTGADGSFTLPGVNLSVPGYYELSLPAGSGSLLARSEHIDARTPMPLRIVGRREAK